MINASHVMVVSALAFFAGTTLVLAQFRWFRRPSLSTRLQPFVAVGNSDQRATLRLLGETFLPNFDTLAAKASETLGIKASLATRLQRAKIPVTAAEYRSKQLLIVVASTSVALVAVAALRPALLVAALLIIGLPALAFLISEQHVTSLSERNCKKVINELATFSEQLAMLLDAGYSLGAAINRVSQRDSGFLAREMKTVHERTLVGIKVASAFKEWADLYNIPALDRLAEILQLGSEAGSLGQLVSDEARQIRADLHRRDLQVIEKQAQLVWVPVTVATLVPGVILLTIPFLAALELFTGS